MDGQGYSKEQIDSVMAGSREAFLQNTGMSTYAELLENMLPDTRIRLHSPPRLPMELNWGLRLGAARLFKVPKSNNPLHLYRILAL